MKSSNLAFKAIFYCLLIGMGFPLLALAQTNECPDCELVFNPVGTGNTTGDVAFLTIFNPSDKAVNGTIGPFFIPGDALYQAYIIPASIKIDIQAFDSVQVSLQGWCADISKPPVPEGKLMPPFHSWISIKDDNEISNLDSSFYINPVQNPELIAPYYLKAIKEISMAYDSLKLMDSVKTPFNDFADKEREAVIQQTFWIYTSYILGEPYTINDFRERTYSQFEENSNGKVQTLPAQQKETLDKGIADFWVTFEAVGEKAKIVPKTTATSAPEDYQPTVECNCSYSSLVSIKVTKDGESISNYETVEPGLYRFEAIMAHDCPEACEAVISGNWIIDFIPEKGAVLQTFGKESFLEYQVPGNGTLKIKFANAQVICNGKPCPYTDEGTANPNQLSITLPVQDCGCTICEVVEPMKIINMATNTEVSQDSIPWTYNKFKLIPPLIKSNCPDNCSPALFSSISYDMRYKKGGSNYPNYEVYYTHPIDIEISGAGELIVTSDYSCGCKGIDCGTYSIVKKLNLTESNKCCDRIRSQNNGQLKFKFKGGSVVIEGNRMNLYMGDGWTPQESITFDFNLEALFCNLEEDQIIAELQLASTSRIRNGVTTKTFFASDILISRYTAPEGSSSYDLNFSREINGKEVQMNFSIDKESCVYDVQVIYSDKVYETSGPPYLTPKEIKDRSFSLHSSPKNNLMWAKALVIVGHLMRAREYNRTAEYKDAFFAMLTVLDNIVNEEINKTENQSLKNDLRDLSQTIKDCKRTRDFEKLDDIQRKLIQILDAYK